MKGKPWPVKDEKKLKDWIEMKINLDTIVFSFDNKYTRNAIYQKTIDIGLKEEEASVQGTSSSTNLKLTLPQELPNVEESLKTLNAALKALEQPKLNQAEVLRLRCIITGVKIYKELFADYLDYRRIETETVELSQKLAQERAKTQNLSSK